MSSLAWRLRRLRAMDGSEVLFRLQRALGARLERLIPAAEAPAPRESFGRPWRDVDGLVVETSPYVEKGERILAGHFDIFELDNASLGFPPQWNVEPKSGISLPLVFGKTLDYRDRSRVGDIRYLWELNRHLELVTLAQCFHLTGNVRYSQACRQVLESWFVQCPYPMGPNWISALEHGIRLVNWAVAWHLLGGKDSALFQDAAGDAFKRQWLDSIYHHCHFIAGHFSLHSSANNHLFGEYAGLFIASLTWPCWRESSEWLEVAQSGLQREADRQNAADGVNREQAVWYLHEVADMMLLAGLFGSANGRDFPQDYWQRLESMLEFVASLMDSGGHVPAIGDSDNAVLLRLSPDIGFDVFRSLLATGAVLFGRGDFKAKAGFLDDKSRWLLGPQAESMWDDLEARDCNFRRGFSEGGYWIFGDKLDSADEIRLVADAGPLGYLSIAAHGHADALSLTLSVAGREILIDPGTYGYAVPEVWRNAFRGTAAHNTVRIDGVDQSVSGGSFLWLKHASAWCESYRDDQDEVSWVGAHDGYQRMLSPVLHRRKVVFDKLARSVRVTDQLEGKGPHRAEVFWHFSDDCDVELIPDGVLVRNDGVAVVLSMPRCKELPMLYLGDESCGLGWISRRYGKRSPAPVVVWRFDVLGNAEFMTEISIGGELSAG